MQSIWLFEVDLPNSGASSSQLTRYPQAAFVPDGSYSLDVATICENMDTPSSRSCNANCQAIRTLICESQVLLLRCLYDVAKLHSLLIEVTSSALLLSAETWIGPRRNLAMQSAMLVEC